MSEFTAVRITKETKERLKEIGKKGETYEVIIRRLLDNEGEST